MKVHILHVPKTGGISLYRSLQAAGVDVSRSHDPAALRTLTDDTLIVSLLRNPVDRVWSVYRYNVRKMDYRGTLAEFLALEHDPWWWGVRNVQVRYLQPCVLYDTTSHIERLVRRVCAMVGVRQPDTIEWHGRDEGPRYTVDEYAQIAAVCGDHFYGDWM